MDCKHILLFVVLCLQLGVQSQPTENDGKFIGWNGATYKPEDVWGDENNVLADGGKNSPDSERWVEQISWHPRAYIFHNFLSPEECDHIIKTAAPMMRRSKVVGQDGKPELHEIRTSFGTFLARLQDPIITEIEERVARWTKIPMVNQEDMQVLRYVDGQKYGAHYDSGSKHFESPRLATVLLYLTDVEWGGETAFPRESQWLDPAQEEKYGPYSECAQGHVAAKAKRGNALLFFSLDLDGKQDSASMHTGCPTLQGIKWTATIWIHNKPFREATFKKPDLSQLPRDPGYCEDLDKSCAPWASIGECEKNPTYMVGDSAAIGACRLSCGACEKCSKKDKECYNRNREDAGYLSLNEMMLEEDRIHTQ